MFKARLIISYIKRYGLEEYVLNRMYPLAKDIYVDVNLVQVDATLLKKGDRVSVRHVCRDLFEILPREKRSCGVPAGQVVLPPCFSKVYQRGYLRDFAERMLWASL